MRIQAASIAAPHFPEGAAKLARTCLLIFKLTQSHQLSKLRNVPYIHKLTMAGENSFDDKNYDQKMQE